MANVDINLPELKLSPESQGFIRRILGPAAELGDLLSEKVRFYRWQSSLRTMQRAEEIARAHNIDPREIPLKILIPLMEKSSLEEEGSPLIEKWATLLAQSASNITNVEAIFTDILARLSAQDVDLLEKIISRENVDNIHKMNDMLSFERRVVISSNATRDATYRKIREYIKESIGAEDNTEDRESLSEKIRRVMTSLSNVELITINFNPFKKNDIFSLNSALADTMSVDVLIAGGLVSRSQMRFDIANGEVSVSFIGATPLGVRFVAACRGDDLDRGTK